MKDLIETINKLNIEELYELKNKVSAAIRRKIAQKSHNDHLLSHSQGRDYREIMDSDYDQQI